MTFAKAIRWLLVVATALVVVWSFVDVGARLLRDDLQGKRKLSVLYWGDADENRIVQKLVQAFEREHPDVKVQTIHADFGNFDAKLKTMMAAGEPPDLFYLRETDVAEFASMGLVEPVEPLMNGQPPAWMDDFYPLLVQSFRFDGDNVGEGTLYGLPKDFTTFGMYINVDLFKRAGVSIPYDGWTWDEFDSAVRKISALKPAAGGRIYGAYLNTYPAVLRPILWSYGAELFATNPDGTPDFRKVSLDTPEAQAALDMIRRQRLVDGTVYNPTGAALDPGQEFFTGNIGIIGPWGRWMTPRYRSITSFEFDFVPLPHAADVAPVTTTAVVAWAISTSTPNKVDAYQLLQFLCGPEGARMTGELGLAMPAMRSVANSDAFLTPGLRPANTPLFLEMIDWARLAQWPRQREFNAIVEQEINAALQTGSRSPLQAAANIQRSWLNVLDSPLVRNNYAQVNWRVIGGVFAVVLAVAGFFLVMKARREKLGAIDRAQERAGFAFIAPWLIGFAVLTLGPMALSLILAMTRWTAMTPLARAEYVGFANFEHLFKFDDTFVQSLWVTFYFVVLAVPLTQVAALCVALLMNSSVRGIGIFRTIYFLPSVISGVALGVLWLALFNNDFGMINRVLAVPLGWFDLHPPNWFGKHAQVAAIPAFVIMSLWGVGGAMVIYLAGLKGVPRSLYEAATIDGASPWHQFWNVTLPMLSPLVFFNLVMGLIGSFQVFTQAFVMTGRGTDNATLFYVLNLYYQAFEFHNMGYASAMAWVLFALILVVTLLVFRGSRSLVHYEGLKQ